MGLRAVSEWLGTEEPRQAAIAAVASIDGTVVIVVKYSVLALGQESGLFWGDSLLLIGGLDGRLGADAVGSG